MLCRKKFLTPEQEAAVRKTYARGGTSAEMAFVAGVCTSLIAFGPSDCNLFWCRIDRRAAPSATALTTP